MSYGFESNGVLLSDAGVPSALKVRDDKAVSLWLRMSDLPSGNAVLWEVYDTDNAEVWSRIAIDSGGYLTYQLGRSDTASISVRFDPPSWVNRRWHHVAVVTSASDGGAVTVSLYVDGLLAESKAGSLTGTPTPGVCRLTIGNDYGTSGPAETIQIHGASFYAVALSNWQVYRLYSGEAPSLLSATCDWRLLADATDEEGACDLSAAGSATLHDEFYPAQTESQESALNPLSRAYAMLCFLLERRAEFRAIVDRDNFIRYDLGDIDPHKKDIARDDLPEFTIQAPRIGEGDRTTGSGGVDASYNMLVHTGDFRADRGIMDLQWVVVRCMRDAFAFADSRNALGFVQNVTIERGEIADRRDVTDRGIAGWSSILAVDVTMSVAAADMGIT